MLVEKFHGITIDKNDMTQFQNIFEEDVPKAEEVRKDIGTFKGFEFNIYR